MREIDKNDVDVLSLFNWKKPVTIKSEDGKKETTIYMRIVGDNDLQRARVYAFRKSAQLRKKLKTEDTDERIAFLTELENFADKDTLIETIILLSINDYRAEALKNINMPLPVEPRGDATVEDQEKYQEQIDTYPVRFSDAVVEYITKQTEEARVELSEIPFDRLYRRYEKLLIDQLASDELTRSYYAMLVFYSSYADENCKYRLFSDFEEFDNYPTFIKDYLVKEYQKLEVGMDTLKK